MPNKIFPFPPAMGGLNYRDSPLEMPMSDALDMINIIPTSQGLLVRNGWNTWAEGLGASIRTVVDYRGSGDILADTQVFAMTDDEIWDVTDGNTPASVLALGGATQEGRFHSVKYSNSADGSFLLACSEIGGYFTYDGATWTKRVAGAGAGQISGVDPDDLCFVNSWKRRAWFVEKNSTSVWYSDAGAITGTFQELDVGPFMKHGGMVSFIATWSIDAGEGLDDFLVIVTDAGDILAYKGTDPTDINSFGLVGQYYIGNVPVGRRGHCQFGGDMILLSENGLQPISYIVRGGQGMLRSSSIDFVGKIQPEIARRVSAALSEYGWEMHICPKQNYLMVRTPTTGSNQRVVFVMNTNTPRLPWSKFTGIPAETWYTGSNNVWFGTVDGKVHQAFEVELDGMIVGGSDGSAIQCRVQYPYSEIGSPGQNKIIGAIKTTFLLRSPSDIQVRVFTDFKSVIGGTPISFQPVDQESVWGTALWGIATWGNTQQVHNNWSSVGGEGQYISLVLDMLLGGQSQMLAGSVMYESGGTI